MIKKTVVNTIINGLTKEKLLKYAVEYNIKISPTEAEIIVQEIKKQKINVFDDKQRADLIKRLARITNVSVAKQVNDLFSQLK